MAASKIQLNWGSVGFTPSGGSLISFVKVTQCSFDPGGNLITFSGDDDRYPTVIVNDMSMPKCSFQSADIATMQGVAIGTTGSFTATHKDAKAASSGAIVYVMANAVVHNTPSQGQHRQFGSATMDFQAFSSDGSTNPLSFTRS